MAAVVQLASTTVLPLSSVSFGLLRGHVFSKRGLARQRPRAVEKKLHVSTNVRAHHAATSTLSSPPSMNVGSLLSIHIIKTSSSRLASIRKAKATSSLIFQRQTIKYRRTSSAVKQGPRLSSRSPSFSMASPHPHFEVAASNEELQDGLNETLSQLGELSLRVDETGRAMGKEIEEQSQRVTRPNLGTSTPSDRESRAESEYLYGGFLTVILHQKRWCNSDAWRKELQSCGGSTLSRCVRSQVLTSLVPSHARCSSSSRGSFIRCS